MYKKIGEIPQTGNKKMIRTVLNESNNKLNTAPLLSEVGVPDGELIHKKEIWENEKLFLK